MKNIIDWVKFQWFMFIHVELSGFSSYDEWKRHDNWLNEMAKETAEIFIKLIK